MNNKHPHLLTGIAAIGLSLLACEPVFVVGWNELLLLFALVCILLGPPLLRLLKKRADHQKKNQKEKNDVG